MLIQYLLDHDAVVASVQILQVAREVETSNNLLEIAMRFFPKIVDVAAVNVVEDVLVLSCN